MIIKSLLSESYTSRKSIRSFVSLDQFQDKMLSSWIDLLDAWNVKNKLSRRDGGCSQTDAKSSALPFISIHKISLV